MNVIFFTFPKTREQKNSSQWNVPELNNLNYVSLPLRRAQSTIREKNENRQKAEINR